MSNTSNLTKIYENITIRIIISSASSYNLNEIDNNFSTSNFFSIYDQIYF